MMGAASGIAGTIEEKPMTPKAIGTGRRAAAASLAVAIALAPAATLAQDFDNQIAARQGQMRVQAANLGVLVGMARGEIEYDAEAAQVAADNLATVSEIDQRFFWPEGSGIMYSSDTKALPEIWDDYDDFISKWEAYGEAATALQAVAGDGQQAMAGGLQQVGNACGACHEDYQQSD